MDPRTAMLLEAPVGPTILRLALPNVVVMVVQASIGLIETYFVAKLGLDALAGMARGVVLAIERVRVGH
jgi:Na+-driven multidrug efflux pump